MVELTQVRESRRAIVLGGGGVAGIAWEYGLLAGLLDHGIPLNDADLVVGTSAGSVVGATLRGDGVHAAFTSQSIPIEMDDAAVDAFDVSVFMQVMADAVTNSSGEVSARAEIGTYALAVPRDEAAAAAQVAMVAAQLPSREWPPRALNVTAVDATDGTFRVFDNASDVDLARAIMASCSVPGVGPTTHLEGREYMDGGMRSGTNADVATGYGRVLVIACNVEPESSGLGPTLPQAVTALESEANVVVLTADEASVTAFGPNPLLMSTREASAAAGYAQAGSIAETVARFWA